MVNTTEMIKFPPHILLMGARGNTTPGHIQDAEDTCCVKCRTLCPDHREWAQLGKGSHTVDDSDCDCTAFGECVCCVSSCLGEIFSSL